MKFNINVSFLLIALSISNTFARPGKDDKDRGRFSPPRIPNIDRNQLLATGVHSAVGAAAGVTAAHLTEHALQNVHKQTQAVKHAIGNMIHGDHGSHHEHRHNKNNNNSNNNNE